MGYRYSRDELKKKIDDAVEKKRMLYQHKCINYSSNIKGTHEKCTEFIAGYLLENSEKIKSGISQITRASSYNVKNHDGTTSQNDNTRRLEERIAMEMYKQSYPQIGEILNYQVPLKNLSGKAEEGLGKIDLVSYNEADNTLYLLELKVPKSKETLLRCVLELYTYRETVHTDKLAKDFGYPKAKVVASVLLFEDKDGYAYNEYINKTAGNVTALMETLDVCVHSLSEKDAVELTEAAKKSL